MVKGEEMNLLFFFGVLIPALVTVVLFLVFCYCWYKMKLRNEVLYKKHDPHHIEKLKEEGRIYEPPPPPPPPFKSSLLLFPDSANNNNKSINNDNYEEQPEPTEGFDNPAMYRTNPDSGFSDLNHIQCNVDQTNNSPVQRHDNSDLCRPNSQASDDSDDSGFRSSRSGQYIHSASNSTGNAHDNTTAGLHSLHVQDTVPLFHPIKIHPKDPGRPPMVSYVNRSSSKHKGSRQRLPLPPSQNCSSSNSESHVNNSVSVNNLNNPHHNVPSSIPRASYGGGVVFDPPCNRNDINHVSKSVNDVHGGRLHSIDSHIGPLTYAGNYGVKSCMDICNHRNNVLPPNGLYNIDGQLSSIGYGSDVNSLSDMSSVGYLRNLPPNVQNFTSLPVSPQLPMSNRVPINSYIPGYNISENSHIRPIKPDPGVFNLSNTMALGLDPRNITFTQADIHKPHIEELSDPKLYSVV